MNSYGEMSYANNIIGNISAADADAGFKSEVKAVFESYTGQGMDLGKDLGSIICSPKGKQEFIDAVTESLSESPLFTNPACTKSVFYGNYGARVDQLMSNTLDTIAQESVMTGYAPIVAYNPFFLKKQWIDCVFKDVLMTEIPKTPVINIGFEKRYAKDMDGVEYPLPEALYDDATVKKLMDAATGLNVKEDPIDITLMKGLSLIDPTYIPGVVAGDHTVELTQGLTICKVVMVDSASKEHTVAVNIGIDISTHNFVKGAIKYNVMDATGAVTETLTDDLVGRVDFKDGKITVMSTTGKVTKVGLRGKIANRYNQRSIDVVRRVEKIEKAMPESGPRMNAAVTIEDAADAMALQKIDIIADNINVMGGTLAAFEDAGIKSFLSQSFAAQKAGAAVGVKYDEIGDNTMIVEGGFNALPYEGYAYTPTEWMKQSREWFERMVGALKLKLRSTNVIIVAVANPNVIRFLQDGINWVFSDDTQISGIKLSYNFGIYTSAQDRVHVLTSMRVGEDEGIRFIVIPLTQELMTFKHYKYNICIDRNYRHPLYSLSPNIMCTQRTLTFEILPVQGVMDITGREMFSPETLVREP